MSDGYYTLIRGMTPTARTAAAEIAVATGNKIRKKNEMWNF